MRQWAARRQLGRSGGDGGSAAASAAALPPRAVAVATKTKAVIVVAGAQLPINNQLEKGEATAREMTTVVFRKEWYRKTGKGDRRASPVAPPVGLQK